MASRPSAARAAAAGDEGLGVLQEEVVDVVALLGAHFEDVAEALGGDEAELGAAALDEGVGDEGGAVDDVADVGEVQAGVGDDAGEAFERAAGGVAGGGE